MNIESIFPLLLDYWPFWVGLAVFIALILLFRMYGAERPMPYQKRDALVTKSELRFYRSLTKAAQDEFELFTMVRIADILQVDPEQPNKRKWLNPILAKHVDFVICDQQTLQPLVCIELDDPSHNRPERQERDIFLNRAFASAGLPLLRIPTQNNYHAKELRELIDKARGAA
jgi:very-short-patch-repair endonuclease